MDISHNLQSFKALDMQSEDRSLPSITEGNKLLVGLCPLDAPLKLRRDDASFLLTYETVDGNEGGGPQRRRMYRHVVGHTVAGS